MDFLSPGLLGYDMSREELLPHLAEADNVRILKLAPNMKILNV